jgi:hypothetical protein
MNELKYTAMKEKNGGRCHYILYTVQCTVYIQCTYIFFSHPTRDWRIPKHKLAYIEIVEVQMTETIFVLW